MRTVSRWGLLRTLCEHRLRSIEYLWCEQWMFVTLVQVYLFFISVFNNFRLPSSIVYYDGLSGAQQIRIVSLCQATPDATWL